LLISFTDSCSEEENPMSIHKLLLIAVFVSCCVIFSPAQETKVKHVPIQRTSAASGQEMFTTYCAVCHGKDAKGDGPAAKALNKTPADLTRLAAKNGGKYPADRVASTIRGDVDVPAHGTREMPIWGNLFYHMSQGHEAEVRLRIANLNHYIESLQQK
jgi:mono/diheme cytochrome c family protein